MAGWSSRRHNNEQSIADIFPQAPGFWPVDRLSDVQGGLEFDLRTAAGNLPVYGSSDPRSAGTANAVGRCALDVRDEGRRRRAPLHPGLEDSFRRALL